MGWTDEHFKRNNQFGQEFASFLDGMFRMHCDFDLGDEILMQKYGGCKNGELFVGKAAYKYVVIPFIKNIFKSTLALFEQYLEQGGTILFVGECPEFVDGEQSDEAKLLYGHKNVVHAADYSEALEYVHSHFQHVYIRNIRNQEETNILMMERAEEEERIVICVNHDRENVHEVMFHLPETGKVRAIDLWSGEVEEISCETDEQSGTMKFVYLFKETESKAFLISRGEEVLEQKQRFAYHHPHEQRQVWKALTFRQEIKRSMPNVLTLDRCSYCLADNEQWSADMEIWQAQREIREQLDMMQIYYNGAVQRYQWIYDEKESKPLKLRFKFEMREIPEGEIYVGIECAENFQVFVNGEEYTTKETNGYYIDKVIKKVKVGNLRPGENEIILTCDYRNDMELEEIYLLGDFSVYADRTLGKESAGVLHGDLCFQGYYHYAGSVEYKYTVDIPEQRPVDKKLLLHIGKQEAAVTKIVINGNTVGFVPWKGRDDFDITDYVIPGTNAIVLEITSSLRNVFGPFHEVNETCIRSSWQDFRTEGEQWNAAYKVMPFGIMENPVLVFSEQE